MSKKKKKELKSKYVKSYKKELAEKWESDETYRVCLKCRKQFESKGPGNRICQPCNAANSEQYSEKDPIKVVLSNRKIDQNVYDG